MDSTDVRIFCEMAFNPQNSSFPKRLPSAADIGKALGLDEKTVRTRVKNMEESGFIKYYQLVPNLALFGLRSIGTFRFEAMNLATKAEVVKKFGTAHQLVEGYDYIGNSVVATFAGVTSADVEKASDLLASRFELGKTKVGERAVREPLSKLDTVDYQIMRELRYDAQAKMKAIAGKLGLTQRMVEYRVGKIVSSGSVLVRATIDPKKQAGLVFFELDVTVDEDRHPEAVRKIRERYSERLWQFSTPTAGRFVGNFFAFSLGEPEDVALEVREMKGVRMCLPFVLKETVEPGKPNWIDRLIEQSIERTSILQT